MNVADVGRSRSDSGGPGHTGSPTQTTLLPNAPDFGGLRLSWSRLSRYSGCGESYRLQYVEHVPFQLSGAVLAGRAQHTQIERLINEDHAYRNPALVEAVHCRDVVLEFVRLVEEEGGPEELMWGGRKRALRDENTNRPIKDAEGKTILVGEDFRWFCKMLPTWTKRAGAVLRRDERRGLHVVEASVERQVTAWLLRPAEGEPGVTVTGVIDVMLLADDEGQPRIRDWKTGSMLDVMQLADYAWLLEQIEDDSARIRSNIGEFVYLRGASDETWVQEHDLTALKPIVPRLFLDMVHGIRNEHFALHPTSFCGSCWVKESCVYGRTLG